MSGPDWVTGDELGTNFPTTIEPLLDGGAEFLTTAFQATGALDRENAVTEVRTADEFFGGGMGRKLELSVAYARPDDALHTRLFVKMPRLFGDPLRELFAPLMEPEVRFALLSRQTGFPIAVPQCYFADYDRETSTGILITERIAYGDGRIEPCHEKCLDYELDDPLDHYRAMAKALARLAGHHQAGRFGPEVNEKFPFDPESVEPGSRIPYNADELEAKCLKLEEFAERSPGLFAEGLSDPEFLKAFRGETRLVLEHEAEIRSYLNGAADSIALCHWNANLDNAWFREDDDGELSAGLLDWGSVGQMNLAQGFFGMTCAAETGFLNRERRGLVEYFLEVLDRAGGRRLDPDEFLFQYRLAVAVLGIAWILDAPSIVEDAIPEIHRVDLRADPRIRENFLGRAQLQILNVFLNEWRDERIGDALRHFGKGRAGNG